MRNFIPIEAYLRQQGFSFIVGIDEAGRGPLAGPVVSAAVVLKPNAIIPGLDDSKRLSPQKREALFELVLDKCLDYAIAVVSHKKIDEINILNATRLANQICIESLEQRPDIALIDGRDKQILEIPFQTIIKGDSQVKSIAAASILAKVTRDHIMNYYSQEYSEYGFEKHMGYGTRVHRSRIEQYGRCPIHRNSFTVKSL